MAKQVKKRGISICSGCIGEFKNTELINVTIIDQIGMKFCTIFCEKCIKTKNIPKHEKLEINGPVAKPRTTKKNKI